MRALRTIAVCLALALMIGELWRSWGVGRPILFVIDDQIMGALLIIGAWLTRQDTLRRRAFFAAAWGFNAGQLYPSFFEKVVAPEGVEAGNWSPDILTALVGVAFIASVVGMVLSFVIPRSGVPS